MQYKESSFSFIAEVHPVLLEQKNLAYAKKQWSFKFSLTLRLRSTLRSKMFFSEWNERGFSWLYCQAEGCLWESGKKWLCLHKQGLPDGYRQMLIEHAVQTRVFKVFVFFNSFAQEHNKRGFSVFVPFVPLDVLQLKTFCHFNKYHMIDNQTIGICR